MNLRLLSALIPFLLLSLTACKTDYPGQEATMAPADAPVPVKVVPLALSTEVIPIEAGGAIGAKEEAKLSFKIGGIISQVNAKEGQYVRRGTVLARLNATEIDAQVRKARQAAEKLERDLERAKKLYAEQAATLEQVEGLTTALEVAISDLEIAGFNQAYAKITAPVSGRIVKRFAERGELIGPGNPVFLMIGEGSGSYVLRVGVADRDVLTLAMGDRAEVKLDAYQGAIVPAVISEIAAAADPRTGTFEVELTLNPEGRTLRNGFIGRAKVFPSQQAKHYRLPLDALVEGEGRYVRIFYPDDQGKARAKNVRFTRLLDDEFVVPEAELTGISEVITMGAAYLTEGAAIQRQ
ncbi:efflux RND transporter periplasmic adaptor subunit [Neolewinella persica]|uniref:efflux RND transporter periplasmic adaptor subunit n=1 Tax=Neolewinella persica TaxID=70998 RepID=UPI00036FDFF0|nr:efflux RND transporter periplasmic adaptor subunit [Neolewinella persica]